MTKALAILISLSATLPCFAQIDTSKTVASVNGEAIKGDEYYRRMEFLSGVGKRQGQSFAEFPPGFLTIEQLITERLILGLAKQKSVYPSDLELQAEMKHRLEDDPKLIENWKLGGRTEDDLLYQVRIELAQFKIQTAGITITDQEVETYYAGNPEQFTLPKRYKLRVIVVDKPESKAAVDKELASGKSFAEVAESYSLDITKSIGGEYGTIPVTAFAPEARKAIEAVQTGQVTQWLSAPQGDGEVFTRFKIEGIEPASKQQLDPSLRRRIRRKLMMDKGQVKNDIGKEMREFRTKAQIDIGKPEFAEIYRKFVEAYLKG